MASYVGAYPRASILNHHSIIKLESTVGLLSNSNPTGKCTTIARQRTWRIRASNVGGDSYLDLWKNAVTREKKTSEFERITGNSPGTDGETESPEDLEKKSSEFQKILEVSSDERDRAQRMQVIDRAAAAIAAARAILKESSSLPEDVNGQFEAEVSNVEDNVSQESTGISEI